MLRNPATKRFIHMKRDQANPYDDTNGDKTSSFSGGGGGSSSGGSSGPSDLQRRSADQLGQVAEHNIDALTWKFKHGKDVYDISDEQSKRLWEAQGEQNRRNIGDDWFTQIKKLQGSANQLKSSAGDSMTGSNLYNFMNLLFKADNDIDNESLVTQRKNQDTINNDYFEALSQSVNGRNELAADTEYGIKQIANDYNAQTSSIHPDLFDEKAGDWWSKSDGFYDQNKVPAAEITKQGLYRDANAQELANKMYQAPVANSSSANNSYWDKMLRSYNRR